MVRELDPDELIDRWTLVGDELGLMTKRGATKLGFALMLRFYTERGRFPRGRSEIPDAAVEYVARQVGVERTEIAFYEWSGRTKRFHRNQIRDALGFRECTVADADCGDGVAGRERDPGRAEPRIGYGSTAGPLPGGAIEPPTVGRIDRMVRSALHRGEELLFARVTARLPDRCGAAAGADCAGWHRRDDELEDGPATLAAIRSDAGNVSLNTMLVEIAKLEAVRAVGVPADVFADVAPKIVTAWRGRAAVESPSHLREHPVPVNADAAGGAAVLPMPGDHRHPGRVAVLDGAPDQRPRRGAGDQRADQGVQAGHRQGESAVPGRRGHGGRRGQAGPRHGVSGGAAGGVAGSGGGVQVVRADVSAHGEGDVALLLHQPLSSRADQAADGAGVPQQQHHAPARAGRT